LSQVGAGGFAPADRRAVAVVLHEPQLGGATLSLLRVLPLLEQHGWQFSFWVPGRGGAERELRRQGHAVQTAERLLRFSARSLRERPGPARRLVSLPGYLRSWRHWLSAQDAALVHANTLLSLPEVASRPRGGPPLVLHVHEVLPSGAKGRAAAALARRADVVVAVSEAAAGPLRRHGIASTIVHAAVPDPGPPAPARRNGPLVVGTLATISKRKGSDLFAAMAERIQGGRPDIEFRMVGDLVAGGERRWAQDILESALRSGIRHSAEVEPFAELRYWDIFVLPSRMDPCPMALLEAMALGLPVVAAEVGGIPEQVASGSGVLVAPEDVDALVRAVLRLADSPELRDSLGAAARRRVRRLFTLEGQADSLDRVYRGALGAPPGAAPQRAP
jgi:glycosyltransferase involved in cell wall biosynthesis